MATTELSYLRLALTLAGAVGCSAADGSGIPVSEGSGAASAGGTGGIPTSGSSGTGTGGIIDPTDPDPLDNPDCDTVLDVVYRDFSEAHPDFEMDFRGDVVRRGLVAAALDPDRKPVFASSVGCPAETATPLGCANWQVSNSVITSADTFAEWYRDVSGQNMTIEKPLPLTETPAGSGIFQFESSTFFPLEPSEGLGPSPMGHHTGRNYLFTTEIHVEFGYRAGQRFTFRGDDDLWIFVNGKLALDLGSMHAASEGTIDFDAQAADLDIVVGMTYPMDIFHAERHTDDSNFKVTTNISCFTTVVVR